MSGRLMKPTLRNGLRNTLTFLLPLILPLLGHEGNNARLVHPVASVRPTHQHMAETFGKLPLRFEQNSGQAGPPVRFLCRAAGYTLLLTPYDALVLLPKSQLRLHFAG